MSMNHLCGCTGVSASKLELPKQREVASSCKICGGKPLVDGQGALPASMLGNIGLELSGVIDPHLNWRTASKGKPRAVRRARTSFASTIKRRPLEKTPENKDLINKETNKSREMPVSESEKLGVTILGQRFSDTVESVPIKKRRFLFRSPSPPPGSPFMGDESGHRTLTRATSHQVGTAPGPNVREHPLNISTVNKTGLEDRSVAGRKPNLDNVEEQLCDAADFSGISILAAAACNSSSVDDVINTESLDSKHCSFKGDRSFGISESQSGSENKITEEHAPNILSILDDKMDTPLFISAKFPCRAEDETKIDGSGLEEGSSNSLSTVLNKDSKGNLGSTGSLRDGRFYWDLNTVMEAWESPCHDTATDSLPVASDLGEYDIHGGRVGKQEASEGKIVEGCSDAGKIVDKTIDLGKLLVCNYKNENQVGSNSPCRGPIADHDKGSVQNCAPVQMTDLVKETNALNNQGSSGFTNNGRALDSVRNPVSANSCPSEEDKTGTNGSGIDSAIEAETRANLLLSGSASTDSLICVLEPNGAVDKTSNEIIFSGKACVESKVDLGKCSDDCGSASAEIREAVQTGEAVSLHPNQDDSKLNNYYVGPVAEQVPDMLIDGDLCKVVADEASHGDAGQIETLGEEKFDIMHQTTEAGSGPYSSESFAFMSHSLSNHGEDSGGCMTKEDDKVNSEKARLQGGGSLLSDQDEDRMEADQHTYDESKDSVTPNITDDCLLTDAPNDTDKDNKANLANSPVENAFEDHFDCEYYSDASHNEQAIGMEKVEQQGDDESQYEDGEFRESFVHSWEMDGCDEGEAEHVDYGSDNREIDGFEGASDYPASNIPSHVGNFECKNEGLLGDSHAEDDHNMDGAKAEPRDFSSSIANVSDIGTANKGSVSFMKKGPRISHSRRKHMGKKWEQCTKDDSESGAPTDNFVEDMEIVSEGDDTRERSHSASLRMKSSGWDRLPGGHRNSGDAVADSVVDTTDVKHNIVLEKVSENVKTAGSTLRREMSSRIGRPKSPDILHRKDRAYFRGTRNRDHSDDGRQDIKRDIELCRSVKRDDSSMHVRCRGRGDHWIEPSSHQVPSHHDSPGYYGRAGFTHPGSKNAAAVSIAKVESNGFVVAPDGTVLGASGVGHSGRLPRRSANSSPNARRTLRRRGSPIERDETLSFNESQLDLGPRRDLSPGRHIGIGHNRPGRYGPKMVSEGNMERYHGFTPDDSIGSSMPVHHSFTRRDQSFSPQTRPVQVSRSRTRSRSQSRTRSPHVWTSPRRGNLMNNGLRRRTRSPPDFRSEARVGRVRSPHGRSGGFAEHVTTFASSPRNGASPPRASRWIDDRKDIIEHLRDNEYRRFSGRSPPKRLFSRGHRFNPVDASGRLKPDEFYRPIRAGRFTEFSVGRGPRPDDGNGDRRHVDRYEMLPSARQYDILGDVKQLRYQNEEGFRLHNDRAKNAPDFPERGSPRSFDRGVGSQLNNSPPRAKEDMSHFRYGRDGKHKTSYKTYDIQECNEDGTPRRRRNS